jgi:serine/threonine protein kinase
VSTASLRIDPGVRLGPYVLERRLGRGRASSLYLARDARGTRVVVRVHAQPVVSMAGRARFKRDARSVGGIDHAGLARLHGTGEHEGLLWVALAFARGTDLERHLAERGPLSVEGALRSAIQIGEALAVLHDAGVIHRDLAPSKVVTGPEGRVVLVDFGILPRADAAAEPPQSGDTFANTSPYDAPEQIEHGLADERSDVWALGCLVYEMVVGVPPFGRGGSATAGAIIHDEPVFPSHVPSTIIHIVNACLRKNSFARIATARELLVLLRDGLGETESAPAPERTYVRSSVRPGFPPPSGTIPPPPRLPSLPFTMNGSRSSPAPTALPPSSATRVSAARGRVKGVAVRAGIAWFAETYGNAGIARVVDLASPELRAILRPKNTACGLIASGWYDTQLVGELVELIERVAAPIDPVAFGASVGEAIAHDNVTGVHRALFRLVASPALLEAHAQRVWRSYVDEGTLTVRMRAGGSFDARVRNWAHHHPSVCRTVRAMLESALRAAGYTALVLERTHCVGLGDTQCAFRGNYKA